MENAVFYILEHEYDGSYAVPMDHGLKMVYILDDYISALWVDRYYDCGDFEITCEPSKELIKLLTPSSENRYINKYIGCSHAKSLMIVEEFTVKRDSSTNTKELKIKGRSVECILERRCVGLKTIMQGTVADAIRQILYYAFINPNFYSEDPMKHVKADNMVFNRSHLDSEYAVKEIEEEFEMGTNLLEIISTLCKSTGIGFRIVIQNDENSRSVFSVQLYNGVDHSVYNNSTSPVVFSTEFDNIGEVSYTLKAGENVSNMVLVVGEEYDNRTHTAWNTSNKPREEDTSIYSKEFVYNASDINHEVTKWTNTGPVQITMTDIEYWQLLQKTCREKLNERDITTEVEAKVHDSINFTYGKDYNIGDIVMLDTEYAGMQKMLVTEFIQSFSATGVEQYPTLTGIE